MPWVYVDLTKEEEAAYIAAMKLVQSLKGKLRWDKDRDVYQRTEFVED